MNYREIIAADLCRYHTDVKNVGGGYAPTFNRLLRRVQSTRFRPLKIFFRVIYRLHANRHGLEISSSCSIGQGFYIGHPYNITINPKAVIGNNCNIHKGVVIGQTNRGKNAGVPQIGDKVWIGINSAIVGNINIGDDVLIAPNSFVNINIPSHSIVFGSPCIVKHRDNATEGYINHILDS